VTAVNGESTPSVHATAVLTGPTAVLIRGPSGAGKSQLAWDLIQAANRGGLRFARLVADDRAHLENRGGRLLVRPAPALTGRLEIRGLGIRRLAYEPVAAVGLLVDLAAPDGARHPGETSLSAVVAGVTLPRLAVAAGLQALPIVLAMMRTGPDGD